jgi:hypothetical protein
MISLSLILMLRPPVWADDFVPDNHSGQYNVPVYLLLLAVDVAIWHIHVRFMHHEHHFLPCIDWNEN